MIETPSSSRSVLNRLTIDMRSEASTIDTGSSATISAGCGISARAIATRCSWPPESSCGKRRVTSSNERPTLRSAASAAAWADAPRRAPAKCRAVAIR